MNTSTWTFLIRLVFCFLLASILTFRHKKSCEKKNRERKEDDYSFGIFSYSPLWLLFIPVYFILFLAFGLYAQFVQIFPGVLLEIMILFSILTLIMPHLRRKLLASSCANLWFIPCGMLAFGIAYYVRILSHDPYSHWVNIIIPGHILRIILVIWLAGFIFLMVRSILSHLRYRRYLLQDAYPVDETVKAQWMHVRKSMSCKTVYPLMIAPHATSPISFGLFLSTVCVLLPEKDYTPDELSLILRHELIHVLRKDAQLKFLLTFARSAFWFNPLVWKAIRMAAEDTELACDELVLADSPSEIRQQYASLVLNSVGESRGFSSCLSAKASSLRYRLHEVVNVTEKKAGYGILWLLLFAIFLFCGRINITYTPSGNVTIFGDTIQTVPTASQLTNISFTRYKEDCEITGVFDRDSSANPSECDPSIEELYSYIRSLRYCVTTVTGDADPKGRLYLLFRDDSNAYRLSVMDNYIYYRVVHMSFKDKKNSDTWSITATEDCDDRGIWYIGDTVDWDYIESLIPNKETIEE